MPLINTTAQRFKFIGCEIIYREACFLAAMSPHRVDLEFLRKGLHDLQTCDMQAKVQSAIDATDTSLKYAAILLGYARCNNGLVGIKSRSIPLIIPRAHDCITFFFGSRDGYQKYFDAHPGTYYLTTGWAERNVNENMTTPAYGQQGVMGKLGLTQTWEQLVEQYGEDNAKYIAELTGDWMSHYNNTLFLKMGVGREEPLIEQAKEEAARRNWSFDIQDGNWSLLKSLFNGPWDDDFLTIPPNHQIVAREDTRILDVEPIPA